MTNKKPYGVAKKPSNELLNSLAKARLLATGSSPYLASALFSLTFLEIENLGTMGVDERLRVYVDPELPHLWNLNEIAGVLVHEVNHVIREHYLRQNIGITTELVWNIAGDLEINDDLIAAGISLPEHPMLPCTFGLPDGQTLEWYASKLRDQNQDTHSQTNSFEAAQGDCGRCADGKSRGYELGTDDKDFPGVGLSRLEAIREQVAQEVLKSRGTSPAGIVRWANGRGKSQVSWQQILYSRVKRGAQLKSGQVNYSYSRPSRRQIANVILPSLRRPVINVAIVIDSSGSMSQDDLNIAYSETRSVSMNNATGDLTLISCDAQAVVVAENRLPDSVELIGGGGTDMGSGINLCAEFRRIPDVVIVITDGFTPWPVQLPHRLQQTFFVVLLVGSCDVKEIPKWAETVCIPNAA